MVATGGRLHLVMAGKGQQPAAFYLNTERIKQLRTIPARIHRVRHLDRQEQRMALYQCALAHVAHLR